MVEARHGDPAIAVPPLGRKLRDMHKFRVLPVGPGACPLWRGAQQHMAIMRRLPIARCVVGSWAKRWAQALRGDACELRTLVQLGDGATTGLTQARLETTDPLSEDRAE